MWNVSRLRSLLGRDNVPAMEGKTLKKTGRNTSDEFTYGISLTTPGQVLLIFLTNSVNYWKRSWRRCFTTNVEEQRQISCFQKLTQMQLLHLQVHLSGQ